MENPKVKTKTIGYGDAQNRTNAYLITLFCFYCNEAQTLLAAIFLFLIFASNRFFAHTITELKQLLLDISFLLVVEDESLVILLFFERRKLGYLELVRRHFCSF